MRLLFSAPILATFALGAPAQDVSIADGQAVFQQNFETSNTAIYPTGSTPELFRCDPAGDPLGVSFTSKWCFRANADTREYMFSDANGQATFNNAGNTAVVSWADVDARGLFSANLVIRVQSTGPNSGVVTKTMLITNISAAPLMFNLYHFQDIDIGTAAYTSNQTTSGRRHAHTSTVGSSRVDLQACKLEYSIVSPK